MLAKNETTTPWMLKNAARKVRNFYQPKDFTLLYIRIDNSSLAASVSRGYASAAKYLVQPTAKNSKPNLMVPFEVRLDMDYTVENKLVVKPMSKMLLTLRNSTMVMLKSMKAYEKDVKEKEKKKGEGDDDVKHVLPGASDLALDSQVDAATASWLTESYSGVSKSTVPTSKGGLTMEPVDEEVGSGSLDPVEAERIRLQELDQVTKMSGRYINSNTYHNYKHGVDVCHTVYRLLSVSQLTSALGQLDLARFAAQRQVSAGEYALRSALRN
eukprot:gene35956-46699_t